MPEPQNTLFIEGSFRELSEELAAYIDNLKKTPTDSSASLTSTLNPLFERIEAAEKDPDPSNLDVVLKDTKEPILEKLVASSDALNSAPEKEFIAVYNLIIYLIQQSPNVQKHLFPVCTSLRGDATSSSSNRFGLALSVLSTIFNILDPDNTTRFGVLRMILEVVGKSSNFETLKPQLGHLDGWLKQWGIDDDDQRKVYTTISRVAASAGDEEQSYEYRIKALRTIAPSDASTSEARELSVAALKSSLNNPSHFDFEDLTPLDSIQALRSSDSELFQLLDIFTSELLEDYSAFKEEHPGWIEKNDLDEPALERKMRLLTIASIAASTGQTRSLPYARIASDLKIPLEDVEMWVIDVIRAGLVEGKLSQLNQTFLIHRSTYRVFGDNQWREVASRLDMWRTSLMDVLGVIRQEKEAFVQQKEQEAKALEAKVNGASKNYRWGNRDVDVSMD